MVKRESRGAAAMNMNELLNYIFGYGTLSLYFIVPMIAAVVGIYFLFFRLDLLFLGLVVVLVFFNSQTSGAIGAESNTIYYRGSGMLYLPIVTWVVLGGFLAAVTLGPFRQQRPDHHLSIEKFYWAFFIMFVAHFAVGLALEIPLEKLLSNNGLFPLFLSCMVFLWGARLTPKPEQVRQFFNLLIFGLFCRALFGLGRYAVAGGDSVNIYENIEKLGVKVVFFDFHDSTLTTIMVLFSLARLLIDPPRRFYSRAFYVVAIVCGLLVIGLSHHRASILGLMLGGLVLIAYAPRAARLPLTVGLGAVSFAGVAAITVYRLSKLRQGNTGIFSFVYDLADKSPFERESSRMLELQQAFLTILDYPLFGVGSWGRYRGSGVGWQDLAGESGYETVHNGFLQMGFKSGAVGLTILACLFIVYARTCIRFLRESAGWYRCAYIAIFGTAAAMFPNFTIGMVMAQQRGLFIVALLLLLPFVIRAAEARDKARQPALVPATEKRRKPLLGTEPFGQPAL